MKKTVFAAIALSVLAAGILYLGWQPPQAQRSSARAEPTLNPARAGEPGPAASGSGQPVAARETAPAVPNARTLPRPELANVLPGVTAPVPDWRAFAPTTLTIEPVPGAPLTFTAKSVTNDGQRTTWVGTNPEQGAFLVTCGTEAYWTAIVTVPGADEYTIQISPETVRVIENTRNLVICPQIEAAMTRSAAAAGQAQAAVANASAAYTSDLLVLYDAATKAAIGTGEQITNTFTAMVATMNTYLANSLVDNLQWRLVGTAEAPTYPTTAVVEDDLDRLADSSTELGQFARAQRSTYGADQVLLMITGARGSYAGIAYTPGHQAVAIYSQGTSVAAHELAHNFGCHHDRATATAADGDGHYYYAHRFTYNTRDVGTIMSYADYYIPYYSNPAVSYQSNPTGLASTEPKAADNARWLREHAADVANLVVSKVVTAPVITQQPSAVTVTAGQTLSLSVAATGSGLAYQWSKGGVDLSGATAATYSKTAATTDSGSYSVLVSNTAGTVRSDAVAVTVNAAATTTPTTTIPASTSGSGGGGGGGGGLISVLGLLALLAGARRLRARRG